MTGKNIVGNNSLSSVLVIMEMEEVKETPEPQIESTIFMMKIASHYSSDEK